MGAIAFVRGAHRVDPRVAPYARVHVTVSDLSEVDPLVVRGLPTRGQV